MLVHAYETTWAYISDDKNYNPFIIKKQPNSRVKGILGVLWYIIIVYRKGRRCLAPYLKVNFQLWSLLMYIWCDFDRSSSLICGNKIPTICNIGFYCRSYCLLNMFRAPLCPSSGAQEYYTVVAACGISCCGFQVAGLVWSWGLCVRFAGCCSILQTGHTRTATWKPQHEIPQAATTV